MVQSPPKCEMHCPGQTSVLVQTFCQIRSVVSEDKQTDRQTNGIFNIPHYHVGDKNSTQRHDHDVIHQRRCDSNQSGPNLSPPIRSADTTDYAVPRTRTKFGERAFCVAGPSTWNSLPESLRRIDCTETFKHCLKRTLLTSTSPLLCFNFSLFY